MWSLNLVNMRVNNCVCSDFFQEVLAYIEINDRSSKGVEKPIDFFYAEFVGGQENDWENKDIRRIRQKVRRYYRQIGNISGCPDEICVNQIFYKRDYGYKRVIGRNKSGIQMNEHCYRWSFCHLPFQIQRESGIKINDFCLKKTPDKNPSAVKQQFVLHMCIINQPGELRKVLSKISDSKNGNDSSKYDFNIEHIRTSHCRVRDNAKIDMYGYFEDLPKNNEGQKCDGVFYYIGGSNKPISFSRFGIFEGYLDKIRSNGCLQDKVEVKNGNNNPIINPKKALCAVARHGLCSLREHDKQYRQKPKRMVKLQICLQNSPGSLLKAIETIAMV